MDMKIFETEAVRNCIRNLNTIRGEIDTLDKTLASMYSDPECKDEFGTILPIGLVLEYSNKRDLYRKLKNKYDEFINSKILGIGDWREYEVEFQYNEETHTHEVIEGDWW